MKHKAKYILLFSISILYFSCADAPDLMDAPEIDFLTFSTTQVSQDSGNDTTKIYTVTISFTDGNGDLGYELTDPDAEIDVTILDNRNGLEYGQFRLPHVPSQGSNNGVTGEITFKLFSTCCIFPDGIPPCSNPAEYPSNDLSLDIQIKDRAGNLSNVLTTPAITLLCN